MKKIGIIDIETSGLQKEIHRIVEVGLVQLDLETGEKKVIFDKVINPMDVSDDHLQESWIVKNGFMTVDEIRKGVNFEIIKDELQEKIKECKDGVTAFNRKFDINFLKYNGIEFEKLLPCLMEESDKILQLPPTERMIQYGYGHKTKPPKAQEAYDYFYPNTGYIEAHRGADDAMHEADILIAINK